METPTGSRRRTSRVASRQLRSWSRHWLTYDSRDRGPMRSTGLKTVAGRLSGGPSRSCCSPLTHDLRSWGLLQRLIEFRPRVLEQRQAPRFWVPSWRPASWCCCCSFSSGRQGSESLCECRHGRHGRSLEESGAGGNRCTDRGLQPSDVDADTSVALVARPSPLRGRVGARTQKTGRGGGI